MQQVKFERHIINEAANVTAIELLSQHCSEVSNKVLKQAMQYGAVWLTKGSTTERVRRAKKELNIGDEIHIYFDDKILFSPIEPAHLLVDEGLYSVWNKPSGMFSQGTKWGDHSSICRWVELIGLEENNLSARPAFIVHRLDRATQGLMIVAHSKKAASKLSDLFANRHIQKHYFAKVSGQFPAELVDQRLNSPVDGKSASTLVMAVDYDPVKDESIVSLKLETGRKHQIRQHLSGLGFPIIGDRFFGGSDKESLDLRLKSCYLEFVCPFSGDQKQYHLNSFGH